MNSPQNTNESSFLEKTKVVILSLIQFIKKQWISFKKTYFNRQTHSASLSKSTAKETKSTTSQKREQAKKDDKKPTLAKFLFGFNVGYSVIKNLIITLVVVLLIGEIGRASCRERVF